MKKGLLSKTFLLFITLSSLFSYKSLGNNHFPEPVIKSGIVKITGKLVNIYEKKDDIYVYITVPHPITGENAQYKIKADDSGCFSVEVPLETSMALCGIYTDINLFRSLLVPLVVGKETKMEIVYSSDCNIEKMSINNKSALTYKDMLYGLDIMNKMIDYLSDGRRKRLYDKTYYNFLNYMDEVLAERLKIANSDIYLSKVMKEVLTKDFSLFWHNAHAFNYKKEMMLNYANINGGRLLEAKDILSPDKEYYTFLKKLNLNNPLYLYCFSFPEIQQTILHNEDLNIPRIGELDIDNWLNTVKQKLSHYIGFAKGMYYDILVGNAYGIQLINELCPLSDKQKRNINSYFKGNDVEKILLRKNGEIIHNNTGLSNINSVPDVKNEQLLDTIISKYKGKIVVVDFWATWCTPCIKAIKDIQQIKPTLRDKNVVFLYISSAASPYKLWEEKIKGIEGEHYYLSQSQWNYLYESVMGYSIPTYLFYDKTGKLIDKAIGYPGNREVLKKIGAF